MLAKGFPFEEVKVWETRLSRWLHNIANVLNATELFTQNG